MFEKQVIAASIILAASSLKLVLGSEGSVHFSYDPDSEVGPGFWKDLVYEDGAENQCGGRKNSPIAIDVNEDCDSYQDYEFEVR